MFLAVFIISLISAPSFIDHRLGAIKILDYEAHKPFQYRVFMPLLVNTLDVLIPQFVKDKLEKTIQPRIKFKADNCPDPELKAKYVIASENIVRIMIFCFFNLIFLWGFLLLIRKLLLYFNIFTPLWSSLCPICFIFIMPIFFEFPNYMYDFSHLFLFTAGLYLIYKQSWTAYIIVFALAILNKESALMLTVIYVFIYYNKLDRSSFWKLLGWQLLLFIIIKAVLFVVFYDNEGSVVEFHLMWNLRYLTTWSNLFRFEPLDGGFFLPFKVNVIYPRGTNLPLFIFVLFLAVYGWRNKPLVLRKSTIYFPLLIIMAITMGSTPELRAYYDVLPILFLLCILGVMQIKDDLKRKITEG